MIINHFFLFGKYIRSPIFTIARRDKLHYLFQNDFNRLVMNITQTNFLY